MQSDVLPICKYNEVERCASLLTEWLRKLKAIDLKAEKSQSRKKRIWFRVPADPKDWEAVGFDVAQWIKDGVSVGLCRVFVVLAPRCCMASSRILFLWTIQIV